MNSGRPAVVGLLVIMGLGAVSIGAVAAVATMDAIPPTLESAPPSVVVPVKTSPFADERAVRLAVDVAPDVPLTVSGGGRITSLACGPGSTWLSGEVNLAIDGLSVVNLATSTPMWRDLSVGDGGDDVASLEAELARLGADIRVDGRVTRSTVAAVDRLLGGASASGAIAIARIMWIPAPTTELASCAAFSGSPVAAGEPIAFSRGVPTVALADLPGDLVAGDRVIRVEGAAIAVHGDGAIDPEAAAAVADTSAYRGALAEGAERFELEAVFALAEPAPVASVPPGAIYDLAGRSGCVVAAGAARPVTVVGSQLGTTFVEFEGDPPSTVESTPAPDAPPCR